MNSQESANRRSGQIQPAGDLGLAVSGAIEFGNRRRVRVRGAGTAEPFAVQLRFGQSGAYPFAEKIAFELSEYGEQTGHGAARRSGHVECLGERYEGDPEIAEFMERRYQVGKRSSPSIEPPDENRVNFAAARGIQKLLAQFPLSGARTDLFDLQRDRPAAVRGVLAHGSKL